MKNIRFAFLFAAVAALASCTGERDTPEAPWTDLEANTTIADLISNYEGLDYAAIDTPLYIEGVVTGNDISGNLYKKIFLQDSTAGIDIEIEMTNNYHKYPIGQRLVIDAQGLAFGTYRGQPQLAAQGDNVTERLYEPECDEHFHRKGYASEVNVPEPLSLSLNEVNFRPSRYIGRFLRFDSVQFDSAGCVFVDQVAAATSGNAMNRTIRDKRNNSLAVRISAYALFAPDTIPYGWGTVQGILGIYESGSNRELQLFPRMKEDLIGFSETPLGNMGSENE